MSDTQLQKAVLDELNWEPSIAAAHIGVSANDGVVTLAGHVGTYIEKFAAEKATRRVKGVSAVGGKVHLTGTVHSWHARNVAADAAWSAPGASDVVNDIMVACPKAAPGDIDGGGIRREPRSIRIR